MSTGYTPLYKISRNGLDITGHFNDRTTSIRVDFSSGDGDDDKCFITLDDRDSAIARPTTGETISIALGYREVGLAEMGDYTIERVIFSGPPRTITLAGTGSGAHKAMRAPIIKEYVGQTLGAILGDFAQRAGIEASVHPSLAEQRIDFRNVTTSPGQALQELGRVYGFVGKIAGGKLVAILSGSGQSASGQAIPTLVLGPAHFGTWSVEHNDRGQFGGVKAPWFDNDKNERAYAEEKSPIAGDGNLLPFITSRMFESKQEAEAAAKAQMGALMRSRGNADIQLAKGDPWIRDQQRILIRGMRDGVDGSYVTELASHSYVAETGIQTALKAKPPEDGASYETLFDQATPEQRREGFIVPNLGALMGEALRDRSLPDAFARL